MRLGGEQDALPTGGDGAEAPQLCAADLPASGAAPRLAVTALAWTQAADGLLSAEAAGGVAMHRLVGGGVEGAPAALELLWRADAGVPQVRPPSGVCLHFRHVVVKKG